MPLHCHTWGISPRQPKEKAMDTKKDNRKVLSTHKIETSIGVVTVTEVQFVPYKWTAEEFAELVEKKNRSAK
jgi:hypothetical protein